MRHRAAPLHTYEIANPLATHWRSVPCGEVVGGCPAHERGWRTVCDLTTASGLRWARHIRDVAGRRYAFEFSDEGRTLTFTFPAGQQCIAGHRVPVGRPALFVVRAGGKRNATLTNVRAYAPRVFDRGDQWMDDLHEATDRLVTAAQRG